jgi:mono/diheme cytochrome c family protein
MNSKSQQKKDAQIRFRGDEKKPMISVAEVAQTSDGTASFNSDPRNSARVQLPAHETLLALLALSLLPCLFLGCQEKNATVPTQYEPNYLFAYRWARAEDIATDQFLEDSRDLLEEWFGPLDDPKLPPLMLEEEAYEELVSLEKMAPAVGPAVSSTTPGETGLYRQLCVTCHGETGQGRGTVAASQNPYPRDFRRGTFKYKVTARNKKPLKSDLVKSLKQGLAGTQMPAFNQLDNQQLEALSEYVVYLSIRGEFERKLLQMAAQNLDPETSLDADLSQRERIFDVSLRESGDAKAPKLLDDQLETASEILTGVLDSWRVPRSGVVIANAPESFPVAGLTDPSKVDPQALAESIEKGRQLFRNEKLGGCAKCHGESAKGDGIQPADYDEWTKDWTKGIVNNPTDMEELQPFLARGALKPLPMVPRNLIEGKFRGGRDPAAVHHRIVHGVDGATMPAAAIATSPDEVGLQPDDVWHLVNYVLSLKSDTGT